MPSDPRVQPALAALERPIAAYRSVLASARERARTVLSTNGSADRARLELGAFGGSRIDAARFAELRHGVTLEPSSRSRLLRAGEVLQELADAGDDMFVVDVPPGDSLRVVVAHAFGSLGRAFGAADVVELVRSGLYEPERHEWILDAYPFERWSRAEREHAPPLIVTVDGADLRAGALAELLDVGMRLVLIVRGRSTPAPLVRLVTPGTLVIQTREIEAVRRVAAAIGPAIAALFETEAALFTHDPLGGGALWQRLTIVYRPSVSPTKSIGGVSPRQQREELAQLDALAARPAIPSGPVGAVVPAGDGDPADRLADWLLAESGLATET
jgi:hypothetical protein